jgi:hypothetical protein
MQGKLEDSNAQSIQTRVFDGGGSHCDDRAQGMGPGAARLLSADLHERANRTERNLRKLPGRERGVETLRFAGIWRVHKRHLER